MGRRFEIHRHNSFYHRDAHGGITAAYRPYVKDTVTGAVLEVVGTKAVASDEDVNATLDFFATIEKD